QAAGGIGGTWGGYCTCANGVLGVGSNDCVSATGNAGGGGGGGYYGGGAGCWSGGGGGSSYTGGLFSVTSNTQGVQAGNGFITITPTVLGGFTLTTSQTNITCNGLANGTATANPSPVGAYTYSWSTVPPQTNQTATGLSAGTYTVTVVNGGCTVTASVTITQPPAINIVNAVTNPLCNGSLGKIVATVTGGTPAYTYAWTPSGGTGATASNLSAGCYTLTVTDANGCIQTASACITQPTPLNTSMATTLA